MTQLDFDLERDLQELFAGLPVAVTLVDLEGKMVFYNDYAPQILVRKPEFIGQGLEHCHKPESTKKVEAFLDAYKRGERREFTYQAFAYGNFITVRIAPYVREGEVKGLIQAVMPLPPPKEPAS